MSRDLFCAFHPKRVMVPSLALWFALPLKWALAWPEMPIVRLLGGVGLHVGEDRRVGDRFYESRAKHGSRDAEDDVGISALAGERISRGQEVGLGNVAARGVTSAGDNEEGVHSAVGVPLGFRLKRASRTGPFGAMNQGFRCAVNSIADRSHDADSANHPNTNRKRSASCLRSRTASPI